MKLFSVHDNKAKYYLTPFFMKTTAEAIRGFSEVCQDDKSQFNKYPNDFTLVEMGTYDETTGKTNLYDTIAIIANASEFTISGHKPASIKDIRDALSPVIDELEQKE